MSEFFIKDPAERKSRAIEKEKSVLKFLRDEIYSITPILAVEMGVQDRAARTLLNRMEKKKLIIRDEIRFMGSRAVILWGITTAGILEYLTPEEVSTVSLRYHSPGRVSPLTIEHTLDIQRCRQYCENSMNCKDWIPTRYLPAQNKKRHHSKRWSVYPDGLISYPSNEKGFFPICLEIERNRKTPKRYVQIIKGHLKNISHNRYHHAWYFCTNQKAADSLKALFLRLLIENKCSLFINEDEIYSKNECMRFFSFSTMEHF